jgi:hypothetical protein
MSLDVRISIKVKDMKCLFGLPLLTAQRDPIPEYYFYYFHYFYLMKVGRNFLVL